MRALIIVTLIILIFVGVLDMYFQFRKPHHTTSDKLVIAANDLVMVPITGAALVRLIAQIVVSLL